MKTPKAILGENGNLNFVFNSTKYVVGRSYTDNLEETVITDVWDVPADAQYVRDVPWAGICDILSANFDASFREFKPVSTVYWFFGNNNLSTITNADNLDTSCVTNMYWMFRSAGTKVEKFTLDLSSWDVSKVTDMSGMFSKAGNSATTFSLDLSGWDTGGVTNMYCMFDSAGKNATTFNLDLSGWDVRSVTNMIWMFSKTGHNTTVFKLDLSSWNVGNVTDMSEMFYQAGYNTADANWLIYIPDNGVNNMTHFYGNSTHAKPCEEKTFKFKE